MTASSVATSAADPEAPAAPTPVSKTFQRYALILLMIMSLFNFLDRQVVNILAEHIKLELSLADWQIGLLTGFTFAIFYTMFGLPIAHLAERHNRPFIVGASMACWSTFTALSGFVSNFGQLLAARMGVGIGEAGGHPAATSLITDYIPRKDRASALAFFHLGVPLGTLCGLAMGGVVADLYGWRVAFLVAGLPGILVAILIATTLREPRKALAAEIGRRQSNSPGLFEAARYLLTKRSFLLISLASALRSFLSFGQQAFLAAYFLRTYKGELAQLGAGFHLQPAGVLGISLGLIQGLAGIAGVFLGGWLADRATARDVRGYGSIPAIATLVSMPLMIVALFAPNAIAALGLLVIPTLLNSIWYGPVHATVQSVAPPRMRAMATAILLLTINLIGLGLGPLAVGGLSDLFSKSLQLSASEGLRWALVASTLISLPTFALYWACRRTIRTDIEG